MAFDIKTFQTKSSQIVVRVGALLALSLPLSTTLSLITVLPALAQESSSSSSATTTTSQSAPPAAPQVPAAPASAAGEEPVLAPGSSSATHDAGAAAASHNPQWMQFLLPAGLLAFMYLFIIRPTNKQRKAQKDFLDSLTTGQEVITSGGLIGKVTSISDTIVTIDLGAATVRVLKSAVSGRLDAPNAQNLVKANS